MNNTDTLVLPDYPWIARRPITVTEYHKMVEAGILHEDDRVELIEGQIIEMAPIGSEHSGKINRLTRQFVMIAGLNGVIAVQNPVRLNNLTEPQPDFAVLKPRADDYSSATPIPSDVLLLVEVADSSLAYDLGAKRRLYAKAGIPEYWVVDLNEQSVEVHRTPGADGYAVVTRVGVGGELTIPGIPGGVISVSSIFS